VTGNSTYVLGSTDLEHRRLMLQGHLLRPWTERFLRAAGLRPGMSVLDPAREWATTRCWRLRSSGRAAGSSASTVTRWSWRRRGHVRATEGFASTVASEVTALEDLAGSLSFDAVVGRFVLLYQRDPADVLRKVTRFLRPSGIVAFHEIDLTNENPRWPPCPTWDDSCSPRSTRPTERLRTSDGG
jgi:SAM-dependent methyltransferase